MACDEPLPEAAPVLEGAPLPRSLLAAAPAAMLRGTVLCAGLAGGAIRRAEGLRIAEALEQRLAARTAGSPGEEFASFQHAVTAVQIALEEEIGAARGLQREVLSAHAALLGDVSFAGSVKEHLSGSSGGARPAAHAILAAIQEFSAKLHHSSSAYLRERALDLQDIGGRLLNQIYGPDAVVLGPKLTGPAIVVAESLTPGQFLALDREHLRGLVLQHSGATSHTVILARSFGLPTLAGVEGAMALPDGVDAILDANLGILLPEPNEPARRYYAPGAAPPQAHGGSDPGFCERPRRQPGRPGASHSGQCEFRRGGSRRARLRSGRHRAVSHGNAFSGAGRASFRG